MNYRRPTIIIAGSGRSGTSTVARLCHNLGICMGHELKAGDKLNPDGYYEDIISHGLVRQMAEKVLGIDRYMEIMNNCHKGCAAWGAKDPWFLFLPTAWKLKLSPKLYIICDRNIPATVQSWLKVYKTSGREPDQQTVDHYTKLTEDRHKLCEDAKSVWPNYLTINFDTPQDEQIIVRRIQAKLNEERRASAADFMKRHNIQIDEKVAQAKIDMATGKRMSCD